MASAAHTTVAKDDMRDDPPIDAAHLDRQTFGDAGLRAEILALFFGQAQQLAVRIAEAEDAAARANLAHTLKGSALSIGAFRLAEAAARVEQETADPAAAVALLIREVVEACAVISGWGYVK